MTCKAVLRTLAAGVALTVVLTVTPAFAAPGTPRIPGLRFSTSRNWSGYAIETNLTSPQNNVVTDVKGTWVVTTVSASPVNAYSASWIGIDGYSSGTVEQLGTESDWVNGHAVYSAWYEMYPKKSMNITTLAVKPGDVMTAEVAYTTKSGFTLTMTDTTTHKTFTTTQKPGSAKRSSAEWIVEAPWSGGTLPLANFGVIPFTNCSATVNGHPGPINDPAWQSDPLTMVGATGTTLASPSPLSSGGSAFSMTLFGLN